MSISTFDPASFLDMPVDVEFKKRLPLPVGDYTATIQDLTSRQWQGKVDPTKTGIAYDLKLAIEIPEAVRAALDLAFPTITLNDSIMLDLTAEGAIDGAPGRNRGLRNYRDALDMNKAGETFRARNMIGRLLRVKISHEIWPVGSTDVVERVSGVSKIG